ncbi:relaxase domain-containing protein [Nocardia sp. SYP-A9097]|uniref:MobF family relaxase n=1 Tax=Nocardia sp. SYP-A9097 TaxID=2663237 RepID=UPI00129A2115|nr:MobF family relaxase [Nocardia sp. SYP-A9097]MRH93588.1 relaxase domain-containing protein [Nocardia sp. SYP-A9097]
MTATLHKVLAGNGYLYYLRQVAAGDSTNRGPGTLADYYSARGESPGRWDGSGLSALGLNGGDLVTEAQMKSLFGEGRHPNADAIETAVIDREITAGAKPTDALRAADKATRLGRPFRVYQGGNEFRERCAAAFAEHNTAHGLHRSAAIDDDVRASIRSRVATTMFTEMIGRPPLDARELSGWVARNSRPQSAAVAGFDITFSPVKSVSALWAIAPKSVSDTIAAAHDKAIDDAVTWLEKHAIYSRLGANGIRQVDVEGIIAARFVHRESRSGDPDLHTHLLIANRVRTRDGHWLTLDAAVIYRLMVTVSEIYNTRLEHHLEHDLAVSFSERPGTDPAKRPIREIDGVPLALIEYWSRRDAAITARLDVLAAKFEREVGREPMPKEMFALMERATLETRPTRHRSRSWAEQRADWRRQAETILGSPELLSKTVSTILSHRSAPRRRLTSTQIADIGRRVVATVSAERSSWQWHHVRAEAERQLRGLLNRDDWATTVEAVVSETLSPLHAVARGDPDLAHEPVLADVPPLYQRTDRTSVYTSAGTQTYTSVHRLGTTQRLIELSLRIGAHTLAADDVDIAIRTYHRDPANAGRRLNAGQVSVITDFARSPWFITTTNAPAGAGKTTAMRVLADAWRADGGTVLGLAPTAAAAAVLGEAIDARTETVDKLLDVLRKHSPATVGSVEAVRPFPPSLPQWVLEIDARTLVIVDEHVRLGDDKRLALFDFLLDRQAPVRCVGDDHQLPAIEASGSAADTADAARASTMTQVVRFASTIEASASLALREGDPSALGFYLDHQRIRSGSPAAVREQAYAGWIADQLAGRDTVMLAATNDIVTALNDQARGDRIGRSDTTVGVEAELADGLRASIGDIVSTRRNNPRLRLGQHDWVRNGYRWTVTAVHPDGAISVTHLRSGRRTGETTVLPADYVREHVRLGYAMTIDSAQGITADTCHVVLTGTESRNQLYVALTRGATTNTVYVTTAIDGSEASFWTEPGLFPRTAVEVLQRILARDNTNQSAHTELRDALDPHQRLGPAIDAYHDALALAAEHALGTERLTALDAHAEHMWPGLTDAPAYPALREVLSLIALSGHDPHDALASALAARELGTAADPAAVLHWRLDTGHAYPRETQPLPWVRGLPRNLPEGLVSEHLRARAHLTSHLAEQIRADTRGWTATTAPVWARPLLGNDALIGELTVWRAGRHTIDTDLRPTGPPGFTAREHDHQRLLDVRVTDILGDLHTAIDMWSPLAKRLDARVLDDPWWPQLADKLDAAARTGLDIDTLLTHAASARPLPDEMPAAALWFRLGLDPSALQTATDATHLRPDWTAHLHQLLGEDLTDTVLASPAWPRLVAAVDHGTAEGWDPRELLITAQELLAAAVHEDPGPRPDQYATALAWRIEALLNPVTPSPATATEVGESRTTETDSDETMPRQDDGAAPSRPEEQPADSHDHPRDTDTDTDTGDAITAELHVVTALFHAGRVAEAKDALIAASRAATDTELDVLQRVATTLYQNSFPVAKARLRWAAEQFPQHRALIEAATPATDPHTYNPDFGVRPSSTIGSTDHAARDHEPRIDDSPARVRPTATDIAAARGTAEYLDTRADVDAAPRHLPLPEGAPHRYYNPNPHDPRTTQQPLDYDLAAVPDTRGFDCVHCGLERAVLDATPPPGRRGDDGLCGECRDNDAPAIPDHEPRDHIAARCAHIADVYPTSAALTMLRRDWYSAPTADLRAQIETWVTQHLTDAATPSNPTDLDPATANPLRVLADAELAQRIEDITLRLALADTEALLYGPAQPQADTSSSPDNDWLIDELGELQHEQQRRSHLTADAAEAEQDLRRDADSVESQFPARDIGPEAVDRTDTTSPGADL